VVFGQLLTSGQGSVVLRSHPVDAIARTIVAQDVELRDDLAQIPRIADSLTVRLLRELGRTRPISAVPGGSLRSMSLSAIKAFLQGEQLLRRNDYVAAGLLYEQAVQIDSGFAMAYHGLRNVRRAIGAESDSLSRWYGQRAGESNHGLAPRDSLMVLADSLAAALPVGFTFFDVGDQAMLRRRVAVLEELVTHYPDDADAWQELGEARLHFGFRIGISQDSALQAFERAVAADSGFAPAFRHTVELSLSYRAPDSVRALIRRYLHLHPSDVRYRALNLLVSRSGADHDRGWTLVREMPHDSALSTAYLLRRWRKSPSLASQLYRDLLSPRGGGRLGQDTAAARIGLTSTLLQRGRLREVRSLGERMILNLMPMNVVGLGKYTAAAPESLAALARVWGQSPQFLQLHSAVQWFGWQRDTAELGVLAARVAKGSRCHVRRATRSRSPMYRRPSGPIWPSPRTTPRPRTRTSQRSRFVVSLDLLARGRTTYRVATGLGALEGGRRTA
jgi:serine/threonine-protein kinase